MSIAAKVAARFDSWISIVTGLGNSLRDKTLSYNPQQDAVLDWATIQALCSNSDIAYRIVSSLPTKALKQGFSLSSSAGDLEPQDAQSQAEDILAECDRLGVADKMAEGDTWARAYGLGGVILGVDGAGLPEEPLDDEKAGALKWITVIDRREMIPISWYTDFTSDKFGEAELYRIQPSSMNPDASTVIHESRVVRFPGALTSRLERQQNSGCDYSVLQRVFAVLQQTEQNWASVCQLMADMSQGVFKVKGLMDILASGNEAVMQARMTALDMSRSVARAIVLDADGESFERVPTPMGGVTEVLEQTWTRLCAAAEMPRTVLFGVSPAGLNATGESDMRLWYDTVQSHREHILAPRIQRIARLISRTLGHEFPDAWQVTWPSLWQMTASEQALYMSQVAASDKIYIDSGVYLPEEVALTRSASGDEFNGGRVQIDVDARKASLQHALDAMEDPPEPAPVALPPGTLVPGAPLPPATTPAQPKQLTGE